MICDLDDLSAFEDAWDVILAEHDRYVRLCQRMCRGHRDLVPELISEVYDRAVQVGETWDPTVGSLRAHMWSSISLYLYKYMNRREKLIAREGAELIDGPQHDDTQAQLEARDQVDLIRRRISPISMWLLEARHVKGYTYEHMGDILPAIYGGPVSTGSVKKLYIAALKEARDVQAG